MMLALRALIALIIIFGFFWLFGTFLKTSKRIPFLDFSSLALGFIVYLAGFQLLALPFIVAHGNPKVLFYLSAVITFALAVFAALKVLKSKQRKVFEFNKPRTLLIVFGLLIILVTLASLLTQRYDIDDSYYLGMASENLSSSHIYTHDPSTGLTQYPMFPFYKFGSYEIFMAAISYFAHLPVALVAHVLLAALIVVVSYLVYSRLITYIFKDRTKGYLASSLFILMTCFSGATPYLSGDFILARPWQGKALLIGVFVPVFTLWCCEFFESKKADKKYLLGLLFVAEIGAFACSPVAIYLLPPLIIIGLLTSGRLNCGRWMSCLKDVFLVMSLIVIWAILLKLASRKTAVQIESSLFLNLDFGAWKHIVSSFFGKSLMIIVMLASMATLLFQSRYPHLRRFIIGVIICSLVLANPLSANFMANHVTTAVTYWRIFWLTFPELIVASTLTYAFGRFIPKSKVNYIAILPVILSICLLAGSFLFKPSNEFELPSNIYKIPNSALLISKLPNSSVVLSDQLTSAYVRSINPKIKVAYSREAYMIYNLNGSPTKLTRLTELVNCVEHDCQPASDFTRVMNEYSIDYIAYPQRDKRLSNYLSSNNIKIVKSDDGYIIRATHN